MRLGDDPNTPGEFSGDSIEYYQECWEAYESTWSFLGIETDFDRYQDASDFAPIDQQVEIIHEITSLFIDDIQSKPWSTKSNMYTVRIDELKKQDQKCELSPALFHTSNYKLIHQAFVDQLVELRAVYVLIGIHRHRVATGAWPRELHEISDEHLPLKMIDPHTGNAFGYALIDDQPTLWSGGSDRDDDQGSALLENKDHFRFSHMFQWFTLDQWDALDDDQRKALDGDLVQFPPDESERWGNEEH